MRVNDPGIAFLLIMQFIHQFGHPIDSDNKYNSFSLLEEFREIGFDKVIDTNDEFSKLKLKIDDGVITVKILKNHLYEYSIDLFPDFPCQIIKVNKKGFLGRILKSALRDYKKLKKISNEIFMKIDEEFPTLKPERASETILKRRIGVCDGEEIVIVYDYKSDQLQVTTARKSMVINKENLFTDLNGILDSYKNSQSPKDCGICYSSYLDGQLAAFSCKSCAQIYHETCLREWYNSNPECRTVFDKIIGKCLFCDEVIIYKGKGEGIYCIICCRK